MIPEAAILEKLALTFETPCVLLHAKDGRTHLLESRMLTIEHVTKVVYHNTKPEPIKVFRPIRMSRFTVGGHTINVLCDTASYHGRSLNASEPSASEYLAAMGTEVAVSYVCHRLPQDISKKKYDEEELWKEEIVSVVLPDLKDDE